MEGVVSDALWKRLVLMDGRGCHGDGANEIVVWVGV